MRNNNIKRKYIPILIIGIILMLSVTACSSNDKTEDEPTAIEDKQTDEANTTEDSDKEKEKEIKSSPYVGETILKVDDEKVSYSEMIIYLKYIQSYYEDIFGDTIWEYNLGKQTIGDLAKQDVINTIVERKISRSKWNEYDVTITEEDEVKIKEDSSDYMNNITDDVINYYGITEEIVYQFFFDNLIAERVYDATTMDVDTNISDDEAKQITIQYLLISSKKTDNEGNSVLASEEEKRAAYVAAQELLIEATNTDDFEAFARSNSDHAQTEITFGKGELGQGIEEAAFALKTGEMSNIIEDKDGYLILYCVDDYNEDATLEKKEEIIDERQVEKFQELFNEWQKDVDVKLYEKVWEEVKFD